MKTKQFFKKTLALLLCISAVMSVMVFAPVTVSAASIPKDAVRYKANYYYIFYANSWDEAKKICKQKGGHLAIINNKAENSFLFNYMTDLGIDSAYFGITDEKTEGKWLTIDGKRASYTNWAPGEPNNEFGDEHYGMFYYKSPDKMWNDGGGGGCYYICEWYGYKLNLSENKVYLTKGRSQKIEYSASGTVKYLSSKTPKWSTSNSKVAKVSSKGKIVAINPGVCSISCKLGSITKKVTVVVKPTTVKSLKAAKKGKDYITLSWKKQPGVKQYVLYRYDKDLEEYVAYKRINGSFNKTTIYNLRRKTTYKFKVRAYVTSSSGTKYYGAFSKTLSVKTK